MRTSQSVITLASAASLALLTAALVTPAAGASTTTPKPTLTANPRPSITFSGTSTPPRNTGPNHTYGSWLCTVYVADPTLVAGALVTNHGFEQCSGSGYDPINYCISLYRYRWYGAQNLGRHCAGYGFPPDGFTSSSIAYYCSGQGTYTYYSEATGWAQGGADGRSVRSNNVRITC